MKINQKLLDEELAQLNDFEQKVLLNWIERAIKPFTQAQLKTAVNMDFFSYGVWDGGETTPFIRQTSAHGICLPCLVGAMALGELGLDQEAVFMRKMKLSQKNAGHFIVGTAYASSLSPRPGIRGTEFYESGKRTAQAAQRLLRAHQEA